MPTQHPLPSHPATHPYTCRLTAPPLLPAPPPHPPTTAVQHTHPSPQAFPPPHATTLTSPRCSSVRTTPCGCLPARPSGGGARQSHQEHQGRQEPGPCQQQQCQGTSATAPSEAAATGAAVGAGAAGGQGGRSSSLAHACNTRNISSSLMVTGWYNP